jgi:hypothetical protein
MRRVGDRVELIGKIVEVKHSVGRRGRARGKPYVFINFGPWRGSIVKISIWSEGLSNLKEQPSDVWIGRWVSVTGLMDPPYTSKKYNYTHVSISVDQDGQIQHLDEAQARFRLASIRALAPQSNKTIVEQATSGSSPPRTSSSSNQDILKKYMQVRPPASPITQPQYGPNAAPHSTSGLFARIARYFLRS